MKAEILNIEKSRNDIISLWIEVFNDNKEYIEFFLDNCKYKSLVGIYDENKLVSMLFLIDAEFCNYKGAYVYAVATAPDMRKKGLMSILFSYIKKLDYDFLSLVPAEEYLYNVYAKYGFITNLYSIKHYDYKFNLYKNVTKNEYFNNTKYELPTMNILDFDYIYKENINIGGKFIKVNKEYFAIRYNMVYDCSIKNIELIPCGMTFSHSFEIGKGILNFYLD